MPSRAEFQKDHANAVQKRTINDWRRVLNQPEGRRVIYSLLLACGHRQNAFVPGDPHATAYNCAMRAMGNYIEDFVRRAEPAAYEQMRQEYEAESKQYNDYIKQMEEEQ